MVAGLGGGVLLAAADDFAVGGYMIETVLAGLQKRLEAVGVAVGFDRLNAVFTAGFAGVAFAGLDDFAVVGAQAVSVLPAALEDLEGCHLERKEGKIRVPIYWNAVDSVPGWPPLPLLPLQRHQCGGGVRLLSRNCGPLGVGLAFQWVGVIFRA